MNPNFRKGVIYTKLLTNKIQIKYLEKFKVPNKRNF